MAKPKKLPFFNDLVFQNLTEKGMTFDMVFDHIYSFIKEQPNGNYRLMMGTDSQAHTFYTRFITGIFIHRLGDNGWGCIREVIIPRSIDNLHEKISTETSLTEEIASLFTEEKKNLLINLILPHVYDGATFQIQGHIDIGLEKRNPTSEFANEMMSRIESMGLEPIVKPDSFIASGYANKYTK